MRDLKADTEYATCSGSLVVPVEPISSEWYEEWDENQDRWVVKHGQTEVKGDPWAACKPKSTKRPMVRRTRPGVLVDVYQCGRDGLRTGDPIRRTIVKPQDVLGSWREYLALHLDKVQAEFDQREEERVRRERHNLLTMALKAKYGQEGVKCDVNFKRGWRNEPDEYEVRISSPDFDALTQLLELEGVDHVQDAKEGLEGR